MLQVAASTFGITNVEEHPHVAMCGAAALISTGELWQAKEPLL
jgi:hypothetical protein